VHHVFDVCALLLLQVLCNALACAGASMADPLMSMVDTYFSGQLGTTALAALGSNGALFRCGSSNCAGQAHSCKLQAVRQTAVC
jgi:hypothetical protein